MPEGRSEPFQRGSLYTRSEIAAALGGGSRAAFPSRGGRVLAVCVAEELNPRVPAELLAGPGERHVRAARALLASGAAVPLFVRRRGGRWEYLGERRAARAIDDPAEVGARAAETARAGGAIVLVLEDAAGAPAAGPGD